MVRVLCALVLVLFLVACGGGGSDHGGGDRDPRMPGQMPEIAPERPTAAGQAPIIPLYRLRGQRGEDPWYIGMGMGIADEQFIPADRQFERTHGMTKIRHTRVAPRPQNPETIRRFLDIVEADRFFTSPPRVRIADQGSVFINHVRRTVRLINAALPNDFQIRIAATRLTEPGTDAPPRGEIHVDMRRLSGTAIGLWRGWRDQQSARIHLDRDYYRGASDESIMRTLAHEFLHAMGMGHVPVVDQELAEEQTLMVPKEYARPGYHGDSILFVLDAFGLRAMYDPSSLGDWNKTGYQIHACLDRRVCFGATKLQGDAAPFAFNAGVAPSSRLEDNATLLGNATWNGRLVGLTPREEAVAGAARLGINLGTLEGDLDFTGLEYWNSDGPMGNIGTGTQWGDGDLGYGIRVYGNTFVQDGTGDGGIVTGRFTGRSHEYMAGVLERSDLAAGFGGKR